MKRLNGLDAISPAMETAKRQLFKPLRKGRWARLAVVCLLTGESSGGGWSGSSFNLTAPHGKPRFNLAAGPFGHVWPAWPAEVLPWAILIAGALLLTLILFLYISSVYRFILFEAVLYDRCRLREGWRRWQTQGQSYFLWIIAYTFCTLAVIGVVVGTPILLAWRAGIFKHPENHVGLLLGGGAALVGVFLVLLIVSVLGSLFAKDFVVPVMALENVGILDGWRRFLPALRAEKGAFAVYVLMKMVLAVGVAMLVAIADVLILLVLLIPLGIAGVTAFLIARGLGATWTPWTVGATVLVGAVLLAGLLFVLLLVSAPPMVFFQAYALHFFGSRYGPLGEQLDLQAPPEPSSPSPPAALPAPAT